MLRENGVPLGALYLVRLDSEYVSDGALDLQRLFTRENFSERVALVMEAVRAEMEMAHAVLQREAAPPAPCWCIYKGRSSHCTTFAHTNPTVPEYSVHDLARIGSSKKKLAALVDAGILSIEDVPDDFELSEKQRNQVVATKTERAFVDADAIAAFPGDDGVPDRVSRLRNVPVRAPAVCRLSALRADPVPVFAACRECARRGGAAPRVSVHGGGVPRRRACRGAEGGAAAGAERL